MLKIKWLVSLFVSTALLTNANAGPKLSSILDLNLNCDDQTVFTGLLCGEVSGRFKTLYFSTNHAYFVDGLNQDTIATGGFIKYETYPLYDVRFGLSYAGQRRLDAQKKDNNEVSELSPEKDGLAESYISWKSTSMALKIGQQSLDLPFVGNYDWRIMPVLYRAVDFSYTEQDDFIRITALDRFKSYADDQFDQTSRYSADIKSDGMWSVGVGKVLDLDKHHLKGQIWYQSYNDYNYLAYAEAHLKLKAWSYQPDLGIQLMYAQDQGQSLAGKVDHHGVGISLAMSVFDEMTLTTAYNYIRPNQNSYLNGALFAPYMVYTASGPYFAQPFFTSTQDLGSGHAAGIALEGSLSDQTFVGMRYSFMGLKESPEIKVLNQSEYILYAIHNFTGSFKGWSISNFAGVSTSSRSDKAFLQNRLGLTYQF